MKIIEKKGMIERTERWTAWQMEIGKQTQGPVRKKGRLTDGLTDQPTQLKNLCLTAVFLESLCFFIWALWAVYSFSLFSEDFGGDIKLKNTRQSMWLRKLLVIIQYCVLVTVMLENRETVNNLHIMWSWYSALHVWVIY